jgi:hypothetical protein
MEMIAQISQMIMEFDNLRAFSDVIGEAVQDFIGEIPSTEIIGVLETAKACVISAAIKELQGEE